MKNLNELGVQEMSPKEMRETCGGGWFIAGLIGAGFAWGVANFVKDVLVNGERFDMTEW